MSTHPVCSTSTPTLKRSVNSASKLTHRPVGGYHITPLLTVGAREHQARPHYVALRLLAYHRDLQIGVGGPQICDDPPHACLAAHAALGVAELIGDHLHHHRGIVLGEAHLVETQGLLAVLLLRLRKRPRAEAPPRSLFTRVRASHVAPRTCLRYSTNVDILTAILYTGVALGEVVRGR